MTGGRAFDADALRARYACERERRLRPDGIAQYVEIAGEFAGFAADPWWRPAARAPLTDEVDVAVIGAGFGGLLTGARLRELGVAGIRLIDKAADVGGTWYWNRYPGIACDVESYVYLPLLEEVGYLPTEKYAKVRRSSRTAGGSPSTTTCTATPACRPRCGKSVGMQHNPAGSSPPIAVTRCVPGSCRWPTGICRSPNCPASRDLVVPRARLPHQPVGLRIHRCQPGAPGRQAGRHHRHRRHRRAVRAAPGFRGAAAVVFQRTPSTVDVRNNQPTDAQWAAELAPGWQRRRIENFQQLTAGGDAEEDLVADAWTSIVKTLLVMRDGELADFAKMEEVRARVEAVVADPATAEALKPWYGYFCKRPCFHDDYLATFNRDNVTLVDTGGRGVQRITERGVVVDGVEHELDCLIFATGFEVGTEYARRTGFEVVGRDGLTLTDAWRGGCAPARSVRARFPESVRGEHRPVGVHGELPVPARRPGHPGGLDHQLGVDPWRHRGRGHHRGGGRLGRCRAGPFHGQRRTARNCTPGYYNREGHATAATRQGSFFLGGPTEYAEILQAWRDDGGLDGLDVRGGSR